MIYLTIFFLMSWTISHKLSFPEVYPPPHTFVKGFGEKYNKNKVEALWTATLLVPALTFSG